MSDLFESAGDAARAPAVRASQPLADRLRPRTLDELVGQDHLLGPETPLGRMFARGQLSSIILWGRPAAARPRSPVSSRAASGSRWSRSRP